MTHDGDRAGRARPRSGSPTRRSRRSRSASRGGSSRWRSRSSTSTSRCRAPRRSRKAEALAARAASSRRTDARSAARFAHDSATQNYVELEGGGKPAFARAGRRATSMRRTGGTCGSSSPAKSSEVTIRFRPDGAPNGFAPPRAGDATCATPRPRRSTAAAARALARGARRAADWKRRSRAVRAARAVAADAARRARRPHVRLRARRDARRGAHPAAARRSPATS